MNKKKVFVISCFLIMVISIAFVTIVFANNEKTEIESVVTNERLTSYDFLYKNSNKVSSDLKDLNLKIVAQIDPTYNLDIKSCNIECYRNELESRNETVVNTNDGRIFRFDSDSNEFLSYVGIDKSYPKNTHTEEEIREIAQKIFDSTNIVSDNYELIDLMEFDDEIWMAQFAKRYGNLINRGESVKFSFIPETSEIFTLSKFAIQYEDNEQVLTQEEAKEIAVRYAKKRNGRNN